MPPKRKLKSTRNDNAKVKKVDEDTKVDDLYNMKIPTHVYKFYSFCKSISESNPLKALDVVNLDLVGPFEYIGKQIRNKHNACDYHMMWRYFYDTPECLTLLVSTNQNGLHYALLSDDPQDPSGSIIVSNSGNICKLDLAGDNLFTVLNKTIKVELKKSKSQQLLKLQDDLNEFCLENDIDSDSWLKTKSRKKKIVSSTLHSAGIFVELKNGCGYRKSFTTNELKKYMNAIISADDNERRQLFEPLLRIKTLLQWADDEFDFGARLEFGIDLFCSGSKYFHKMAASSLSLAYQLLNRELYAEIIKKHLSDRRSNDVYRPLKP